MNRQSLERTNELLEEMLRWIKFAGAREVRTVLMNILDTEQKRLIYHLSDGEHGSVEIGKAANVSDRTVRRYWKSWARLGIVEPLGVRGGVRYNKFFELEDFGFTIPQIKTKTTNTKNVRYSRAKPRVVDRAQTPEGSEKDTTNVITPDLSKTEGD